MSIRKKIETFKKKVKLAGMIATMGTMTLNSCNSATDAKDNNPYTQALYEGTHEDIDKLIQSNITFDKTAYYDAIKLNNFRALKALFNSGLRNEVYSVINGIENTYEYDDGRIDTGTTLRGDTLFKLIDAGIKNINGELDMDTMLILSIDNLKNNEHNSQKEWGKWLDALDIMFFIAQKYCYEKNPDAPLFHLVQHMYLDEDRYTAECAFVQAYYNENSAQNITTRYHKFKSIYSKSFTANENTTKSFKHLEQISEIIKDEINNRKRVNRTQAIYFPGNPVCKSLFDNVSLGRFKEVNHILKNGGHKYVNAAIELNGYTSLEIALLHLSLKYRETKMKTKSYNRGTLSLKDLEKSLKFVTDYSKTIKILIEHGADPTLVSPKNLNHIKDRSPETYEFLMKTIQNNTIMKNKTVEKSR